LYSFGSIGNFTGNGSKNIQLDDTSSLNTTHDNKTLPVGNLIAFEFLSNNASKVGSLSSFKEYICYSVNIHLELIQQRNDPLTTVYLPFLKLFRDCVVMKYFDCNNSKFVFIHGDLNAKNILVQQIAANDSTSTSYIISGILDFEWAMSGPLDVEFHRGFDFLKGEDPELQAYFKSCLRTAGILHPDHFIDSNVRNDICKFERLVSRLESYTEWFKDPLMQRQFLGEKVNELKLILQRYNCWFNGAK